MTWKTMPTTGKCEIKEQMDPMPLGPYVLVRQHDESAFLKNYLMMDHKWNRDFVTDYGYATYTCGLSGLPLKVAFWYDSSD